MMIVRGLKPRGKRKRREREIRPDKITEILGDLRIVTKLHFCIDIINFIMIPPKYKEKALTPLEFPTFMVWSGRPC